MGVPKVIRSDVLNLMKDVPNFVKDGQILEVGIGFVLCEELVKERLIH